MARQSSKVTERLASDPAQNIDSFVNSAQKQYDKAVTRAEQAAEVLAAAQDALAALETEQGTETVNAQELPARLAVATGDVERTTLASEDAVSRQQAAYVKLLTALNDKKELLTQIHLAVKQQVDESAADADRVGDGEGELATIHTDIALITAALGDVEAKIKELNNKQGKKKRNPAPSKRSRKGSIEEKGLTKEIVAVLAEADKVKTTKKAPDSSARYRLKTKYSEFVAPELNKKFKYKNVNETPKLEKIMLNMGLGDVKDDGKKFNAAVDELKLITGQKPIVTKAKKSIANFKVRQGMNIGAKVTLRGNMMYEFLDKLISVALPRVRDFKGLSTNSFDGRGNYAMGVKEQLIFPEIKYDKIDKIRGFDIVIVTTAKTDEESKELLALLGMPFKA